MTTAPVKKTNPLVERLLTVFGPPDKSTDVAKFIAEYCKLVDGFGPNVLSRAGDHLIRNGGRHWPSPKQCVDACVDAQEREAGEAASKRSATKSQSKMPWEIHQQQAWDWAKQFVTITELGQQAREEGWARELELYAMSYAKNGYAAGAKLPPMHEWKPDAEAIAGYRMPFVIRERRRSEVAA